MTFTLDGHRSLPIEVQSLVTKSVLPTPRRAANGVDATASPCWWRCYTGMATSIFWRTICIFPPSPEPGARARMRSGDRRRIGERLEIEGDQPHHMCDWRNFVDRAGASGAAIGIPVAQSARLGFTTAVVPTLRREIAIPGLSIVQVDTLQDALGAMLR